MISFSQPCKQASDFQHRKLASINTTLWRSCRYIDVVWVWLETCFATFPRTGIPHLVDQFLRESEPYRSASRPAHASAHESMIGSRPHGPSEPPLTLASRSSTSVGLVTSFSGDKGKMVRHSSIDFTQINWFVVAWAGLAWLAWLGMPGQNLGINVCVPCGNNYHAKSQWISQLLPSARYPNLDRLLTKRCLTY